MREAVATLELIPSSLLTLLMTGVGVMPGSVSGVVSSDVLLGRATRPSAVAAPVIRWVSVLVSASGSLFPGNGSGDGGGGTGEVVVSAFSANCKDMYLRYEVMWQEVEGV